MRQRTAKKGRAAGGLRKGTVGSREAGLLAAGLARSRAAVLEWRWTSQTMYGIFAFGFFFFPQPLAEGPG